MNCNLKKCLLAAALVLIGSVAFAQSINLHLRNTSVKEAITELQKQSGYSFVFAAEDLNTQKVVNVDASTMDEAISQIISGQGVTYDIDGKKIVIRKVRQRGAPELSTTISGRVLTEEGEPVVGAVVLAKGTREGVVTDIAGNYAIRADRGEEIEVSSLGYVTNQFVVGARSRYDVVMVEDKKVLDEAVVIGYGTTTRKNLTTAISSVSADKVTKAAVSNFSGLLLGRAAGVQSNITSPQPDGAVSISIRGGSTPVYVVDGIVMPSTSVESYAEANSYLTSSVNRAGLGGINPEDIESIEVLKDASAAIYGIGASDGVILITTKKGKQGRPTVTYSGSYSWMQNDRTMMVLNAKQFMELTNAFSKEAYYYNKGVIPYGSNDYDGNWEPVYPTEYIAANTVDTDWTSKVLRTGTINNHNLTVQGGSDKLRYYLGLNYFDQDGTVYNSGMTRYVIRTNVTAELFPFMRLSTTLNYNLNKYLNSTVGADKSGGHSYGAYQAAVTYPPILGATDEDGNATMFGSVPNPAELLKINDVTDKNSIFANFNLDVDLIKNYLKVKGIYGFDKEIVERQFYIPSTVYFYQTYTSRGQIGTTNYQKQTLEGTLDFHHKFGDIVDLTAVAGMGVYYTKYFNHYFYYTNTIDAIGNDLASIAEGPFTVNSSRSESEKRSQFARVTADFLDRYVISASVRRDGTDKFFPSKKYGVFPAVSAAWKISSEPWMKSVSWVNLLKLRLSYGQTGRDNLGTDLYGVYTIGKVVSFNEGQTMYHPYVLSGEDYDDVSWETTVMKNIALDFSLFKDRVWGSIDWYRNDETNQLLYENSSWKDMFVSRPVNDGHYKRQGLEISINTRNIVTKDFTWTTTLNWSKNETTWVERVANYDYAVYQLDEEGNPLPNEPVSYYYHYKSDGIINSDLSNMPDSQRSLDASWQMPGVPIVNDKNNDGIIDVNDVYRENVGDPKFYFGFGNTFTWKNWDLDIYCYGRVGISKYNYALGYANTYSLTTLGRNIGLTAYENYNSITNPYGTLVGYAYQKCSTLPYSLGIDNYRQDASFLRVRNITLGYTLGAQQLRALRGYVSSIRLYADAQNPFLLTNFTMIDPEINNGGGQSTVVNYPQARTWSLGAKIQF